MRKKVVLKLLPIDEALLYMYQEFLKIQEVELVPRGWEQFVQIRNLVDARDDEDGQFTELVDYSLWELASGVENSSRMSTQQLENSINQLKSLYASRIQEETIRFNKKIQELQAQHATWVTKEEEELEELVQNRIKAYNLVKERKSCLLPSHSICVDETTDVQEILEPVKSDQTIISSPMKILEKSPCPRACFFDLSDISDSADSEIY
jgi:hypothetical protein